MSDFSKAVKLVWLVISAGLFLLAVIPFVTPAEWLFRAAPVCEARRRGDSCVLCGMTTAYVAIGRLDGAGARQANARALPLWGASMMNFSGAVAYVAVALAKPRRR